MTPMPIVVQCHVCVLICKGLFTARPLSLLTRTKFSALYSNAIYILSPPPQKLASSHKQVPGLYRSWFIPEHNQNNSRDKASPQNVVNLKNTKLMVTYTESLCIHVRF